MKKRFSGDDWRLNKISRYLGQVYLSLSLDWSHNSYCLSHESSWEILWAMFMVSWWMEDLLESKTSSWITADKKRRFMIWLILAGVYPIQPEISLKVLFGCAFNIRFDRIAILDTCRLPQKRLKRYRPATLYWTITLKVVLTTGAGHINVVNVDWCW